LGIDARWWQGWNFPSRAAVAQSITTRVQQAMREGQRVYIGSDMMGQVSSHRNTVVSVIPSLCKSQFPHIYLYRRFANVNSRTNPSTHSVYPLL